STLLASTWLSPVAFAASDTAVIDGEPTIAACAELGFNTNYDSDEGGGRSRKLSLAKPAPLPNVAPTQEMAVAAPAPTGVLGGAVSAADDVVVDTEKYPDATPNPVKQVAEAPVSTFSIDVDTASYANV